MAKLDALINKINTLSGVKIIASKFDDRQRAWVLIKQSFSAATGTLYVIDLFGNIIASISGISELGTYSKSVAIGDYCGIMCGTTNSPKFKVYKLNGNSLTLHKTVTGFGRYPSYYYFAYVSSGEYHATFSSISSRETTVDVNMSTGTYVRIEGSKRHVIWYYNYDNSSFCGLIWNTSTHDTLYKAGYINNTSAAGGYDPSTGSPRLSDSYACLMIPLFNFSNSKSDLMYEMFGGIYNGGTSYGGTIKNITGLDVSGTPSSLGYGAISISEAFTRSSECIYSCGALAIIEDGVYKIYTYDSSEDKKKIGLKLTYTIPTSGDNILATRRDAYNIGNPPITSVSDPNRLIIYSDLGDFNCKLSSTAESYIPNQCVKKKDIVVYRNSNLKITVEYIVDDQFSFETEPAIAFYDSNYAYATPVLTILLPNREQPILNANISSYNYFGIVFAGHGQYANQPYFLSGQSNANFVEIVVAVYANSTTYVINVGVHQAGQISDGRYIYTLENVGPAYCVLSETAKNQQIVVTIRTIP